MPVAQSHFLRWHMAIIGLLISISSLLGASSREWIVPEDRSFSAVRYQELGIPSPEQAWSGSDHLRAAEVLKTFEPQHLPRQGSARSGALFDRLIESQEALTVSIAENARLGDDTFKIAQRTPNATALYVRPLEVGLLFDRELIEIWSQSTRWFIDALDGLDESRVELARLARDNATEDKQEIVEGMMQQDRQELRDLSALALLSLSKLVSVGEVSATREETRLVLRDRLRELIPRLAPHLSGDGVSALIVSLRELAESGDNATIAPDLVALADTLATTDQ